MTATGTLFERILPSWFQSKPTVECPSCETTITVGIGTCPHCGADVAVECRACGNTIENETQTCPVCGGTEYETFLLE